MEDYEQSAENNNSNSATTHLPEAPLLDQEPPARPASAGPTKSARQKAKAGSKERARSEPDELSKRTTVTVPPSQTHDAGVEEKQEESATATEAGLPYVIAQERSVIVPLSAVRMSDRSTRSESAHSLGSDRDGSPVPAPRRSTRLHHDRSVSSRASEIDHDDEFEQLPEHLDRPHWEGGSKKSGKEKPEVGMKHIAIERQLNPALNTMWDGFCWRCHKSLPLSDQHGCPTCVRVYHDHCWWNDNPYNSKDLLDSHSVHVPFFDTATGENEEGGTSALAPEECIECYCTSEEEKKADSLFAQVGMDKFKSYLLYMMRFVEYHLPSERIRPFAIPVIEQDECSDFVKTRYADLITCPMDLRQMNQNISDGKYTTCASFLSDLRWIYHNTSIFNGQNNRYTRSASYIVETCRNLCNSLEWCMECFERGMPLPVETIQEAVERGMVQPCSEPHAVVWVKADKYPIWPAIVYRYNGAFADVRFFGAFEFGSFPRDAVYLYCKSAVTDRRKGRLKLDYENALRQFRLHVSKLRLMGEVFSYPKKTVYDGRLKMFPEGEALDQNTQQHAGQAASALGDNEVDHELHEIDAENTTSVITEPGNLDPVKASSVLSEEYSEKLEIDEGPKLEIDEGPKLEIDDSIQLSSCGMDVGTKMEKLSEKRSRSSSSEDGSIKRKKTQQLVTLEPVPLLDFDTISTAISVNDSNKTSTVSVEPEVRDLQTPSEDVVIDSPISDVVEIGGSLTDTQNSRNRRKKPVPARCIRITGRPSVTVHAAAPDTPAVSDAGNLVATSSQLKESAKQSPPLVLIITQQSLSAKPVHSFQETPYAVNFDKGFDASPETAFDTNSVIPSSELMDCSTDEHALREPEDASELTETVKPIQFDDDSDSEQGDMPASMFDMPDDTRDVRSKSAGKLDLMLKRSTATPEQRRTKETAPDALQRMVSSVGLVNRMSVGALTHELNKSLSSSSSAASNYGGNSSGKSVLHEALVRPYAQQDPLRRFNRRQVAPSMASGQSHLIEALRASPKPGATHGGFDSSQQSREEELLLAQNDIDSAQNSPAEASRYRQGERRPFREETLGSLLAAGTSPQHRPTMTEVQRAIDTSLGGKGPHDNAAGNSMTSRDQLYARFAAANRAILPKPDSASPVVGQDSRGNVDPRRTIPMSGTQSGQQNAGTRNLQLLQQQKPNRTENVPTGHNAGFQDRNLQRSILARSLNAPTLAVNRHAPGANGGMANGVVGSNRGVQGPSSLMGEINGDRLSPSALQSAMRNLVSSRSAAHSPSAQDALRATAAAVAARANPSPAEPVQTQVELFLRNTKKIIREKRLDGGQAIRDIAQAHADGYRLLQEALSRSQQVSEKIIQELQEALDQSVKKFELLFLVFQNESEFNQKAKLLEISRMKDLERQRLVTAAKRSLWCCVCQKRANLVCCGVTMYCSESCQLNNTSLHRVHCRRLQQSVIDEQDMNVYTPFGVLSRCAMLPPNMVDDDELEETGFEDLESTGGAYQGYLTDNGWEDRAGTSSSIVGSGSQDGDDSK